MATISLRRIKDKLLNGLPSKTVETVSLQLSGKERELYDRIDGIKFQGFCRLLYFC
jgi:SWI/SNF-related matrix-associated actin-dependent regulator of chromatin subfamily A3